MAQIEVSPEHNKVIKQFAADWGCTADEAAERLITTAAGRLAATRTYAAKQAKGAGKAKQAAKSVKKSAKAKGPIARKAKGAAKKAKAPKTAPAAEAQA